MNMLSTSFYKQILYFSIKNVYLSVENKVELNQARSVVCDHHTIKYKKIIKTKNSNCSIITKL